MGAFKSIINGLAWARLTYFSCIFPISEYFLQFGTSPSSIAIFYATVYKKKINIFPIFLVDKNFVGCKIPRLFDILFSVSLIWFFRLFSLNKTPKTMIWSTRIIRVLFIFVLVRLVERYPFVLPYGIMRTYF